MKKKIKNGFDVNDQKIRKKLIGLRHHSKCGHIWGVEHVEELTRLVYHLNKALELVDYYGTLVDSPREPPSD